MTNHSDRRSLLMIFSVLIFVVAGTYILSLFARGYQIDLKNGPSLNVTGILSVVSRPKGASVYLDDKLITATDSTINLVPGQYALKIVKDGYLPWQKNIQIKKEIVYSADVQLFRSAPDLKPITLSGAINPTISPDFSKIVYAVASASAQKDNGLYLIELADNPLNLNRNSARQIAPNFPSIDWSKANFSFSPNSKSLIATFPQSSYLIENLSQITQNNLVDISLRLPTIQSEWKVQEAELVSLKTDKLPKSLVQLIATDSAKNISYNQDDTKVLYLAKKDGTLEQDIISSPPAQSTQIQSRNIKANYYYVYDITDDTNFMIASKDSVQNITWINNTNSLVYTEGKTIQAIEYDGTNKQTIYVGNADNPLAYPWADGSRIITLTAPYTGAPINLYTISLR